MTWPSNTALAIIAVVVLGALTAIEPQISQYTLPMGTALAGYIGGRETTTNGKEQKNG